MKKTLFILILFISMHTTAIAQDVGATPIKSAIVSEEMKIQYKPANHSIVTFRKTKEIEKENNFNKRSNEVIETAAQVYKELLPIFISAVKYAD